ncbi:MAG: M14 family zinc carboxypeptidase [Candidatus Thorarchaeota archaeon]|jgi:hypothetical protein
MSTAAEGGTLSITIVDTPAVERTWDDVSLLYGGQFHDSGELDEEIDNIHTLVPELVDIEVIGETYQGRNITALRITNELNTEQKAKTLVVAQHHGREQITVEMALRFILKLLNLYGVDEDITSYIDTEEIYVIPSLNLDALDIVVNEGQHWLRKNLRPFDNDGDGFFDEDSPEDVDGDGHITGYDVYTKTGPGGAPEYQYTYYEGIDNDGDGLVNEDEAGLVDLNRNYAVGWGNNDSSSPDPLSQVYRGTGPFSEPETIAFRDFALKHSFSMAYSLHSGINVTFFATNSIGNWVEPSLYYGIAQDFIGFMPSGFNDIYGFSTSTAEQTRSKVLDTAASGYWEDWMYQERRTVAPITFELYHNGSVDEPEAFVDIEDNSTHLIQEWKGIYGFFNPIESFIDDLWDDMMPAFDYLLEMTPRLLVTSPTITGGTTLGADISVSVSLFCESLRIDTTDDIGLYGTDWNNLDSWLSLDAEEGRVDSATFALPVSLADSNYTLYVGNNFTGYTRLVITSTPTSFDYTLLFVGAGAIAVVIVLVIVWKRTQTGE